MIKTERISPRRYRLVLDTPKPSMDIVPVHVEYLEDTYGIKEQPETIEVSGFRFRKIGDFDYQTFTVPYMWERSHWRWHRFVHACREWRFFWIRRFVRLRAAWKGPR